MTIFLTIFTFACGAVAGSFVTALVWRERLGRSMWEKHSVCPQCQHPLGPLDLVPILSWGFLRGKCRYCRKPISVQYILTELTTAILFTASAMRIWQLTASNWQVAVSSWPFVWMLTTIVFTWIVLTLFVALFVYDLRWGELPNKWTLGGSGISLIAVVVASLTHQPLLWQPNNGCGLITMGCNAQLMTLYPLLTTTLSGIFATAFFLVIVYGSEKILKKPGMGMGDVKLSLFMGLFLGFPGIIVALYLAFIFGTVISLGLISAKRAKLGMAIPFGPFLVAGTMVAIWATPAIAQWYQQFL